MKAPEIPDFGIKWPPGVPLIQRHQWCAYHNKGFGAFYHRKERIKALWPDDQWHRWSDRRLRAVCDYHWVTWMGPASAAKTADAAKFALEYYLQAPDRTCVLLCSTTKDTLRSRIWGQLVRYHQKLPKGVGNTGHLMDTELRILWTKGDHINGIFGKAVEDGPPDEIINNLIGYHTERVLLVLDELQGIKKVILTATSNMVANPRFDMWGLGNPGDLLNPLCRESEPIGGWDSVERAETEEWETLGGPTKGRGICQFFDGRKSPADDSPEERKRLPFLCNKDWYAGIVKGAGGNENDPRVWQFGIGWPPATGLESTVLDDSIITMFKCMDRPVWTDGFVACAALDPAFNGGDDAILRFLKRGEVDDSMIGALRYGKRWVIGFDDWLKVPIDATSSIPIEYQIVNFCKFECEKRKIPPREFALDASGRGAALASIFDKEWGEVVRIESGGSPSDLPVDDSGKTAREAYDNRSSELCISVREFAMAHGIRGMSEEEAKQGKARRTFYRNGKWCVEPKTGSKGRTDEKGRPVKGFKDRLGYSPDHFDAAAVGVMHCRQQGAVPATLGPAAVQASRDWTKQEQETVQEFSEDNYLQAANYDEDYANMT